jgi:hypothetical protein
MSDKERELLREQAMMERTENDLLRGLNLDKMQKDYRTEEDEPIYNEDVGV